MKRGEGSSLKLLLTSVTALLMAMSAAHARDALPGTVAASRG
jgi:hypothetical protein